MARYCFEGALFDSQRSLLFSEKSVASPLHQWSTLTAIGCVRPDCRAVIGRIRLDVKSDWLVTGKAEHHCVDFFFLPAVQTVHMFQVNKPGVDISAAVF